VGFGGPIDLSTLELTNLWAKTHHYPLKTNAIHKNCR